MPTLSTSRLEEIMNYKCVTKWAEIKDYLSGASVVAFDFETAPDEPYRNEEKAALDAHKSHIVGISFSVEEDTAIYVPLTHKIGTNADIASVMKFLTEFAANPNIIKVAQIGRAHV